MASPSWLRRSHSPEGGGWWAAFTYSPEKSGSGRYLCSFLAGVAVVFSVVNLVGTRCLRFVLVVVIDFSSSLNEPFVSFSARQCNR